MLKMILLLIRLYPVLGLALPLMLPQEQFQ